MMDLMPRADDGPRTRALFDMLKVYLDNGVLPRNRFEWCDRIKAARYQDWLERQKA